MKTMNQNMLDDPVMLGYRASIIPLCVANSKESRYQVTSEYMREHFTGHLTRQYPTDTLLRDILQWPGITMGDVRVIEWMRWAHKTLRCGDINFSYLARILEATGIIEFTRPGYIPHLYDDTLRIRLTDLGKVIMYEYKIRPLRVS